VSRDVLDGLGGLERSVDRGFYEPGLEHDYSSHVDRITAIYIDIGNNTGYRFAGLGGERGFNDLTTEISEILEDEPAIEDPCSFIHDVIDAVRDATNEKAFQVTDEIVLSPLLQALYNQGHNDFVFSLEMKRPPPYLLRYLRGTKQNPMRISCSADARCVANRVEYVNLQFNGSINELGTAAKRSVLTANGEVNAAGSFAARTEFYVPSLGTLTKDFVGFGEGCTFYVDGQFDDSDATYSQSFLTYVLRRHGFWWDMNLNDSKLGSRLLRGVMKSFSKMGLNAYRNRLFIPSGDDGDWEEVFP